MLHKQKIYHIEFKFFSVNMFFCILIFKPFFMKHIQNWEDFSKKSQAQECLCFSPLEGRRKMTFSNSQDPYRVLQLTKFPKPITCASPCYNSSWSFARYFRHNFELSLSQTLSFLPDVNAPSQADFSAVYPVSVTR